MSLGSGVVLVCGESFPHTKLGSSSFWAANRLALVRCSEDTESVLSLCVRVHPLLLVARQEFIEKLSLDDVASITGSGADAHILAILNQDHPEAMIRMLQKGCHGVFPPRFTASVLRRAIPAILEGEIWAPRRVVSKMLSGLLRARNAKPENVLTPREAHILELVARGYKNSEIAAALFISQETVRWHKRRLHRKIGRAHASAEQVQVRRIGAASQSVAIELPTTQNGR